jgi:hypothetical protein
MIPITTLRRPGWDIVADGYPAWPWFCIAWIGGQMIEHVWTVSHTCLIYAVPPK